LFTIMDINFINRARDKITKPFWFLKRNHFRLIQVGT
jgi:hypothetical protein